MSRSGNQHISWRRLGAARWSVLLTAAVILLIFLYGIGRVVQLRYSLGDVYPPYSTLRYDPLGTSALYHALESMPGLKVARYQRSLATVGDLEDTTLFILGAADSKDPVYVLEEIEAFVHQGNRLVIAYSATAMAWWDIGEVEEKRSFEDRRRLRRVHEQSKEEEAETFPDVEEEDAEEISDPEPSSTEDFAEVNEEKEVKGTEEDTGEEDEEETDPFDANISERWGYLLEQVSLEEEEVLPFDLSLEATERALPERLEMYSPVRMKQLDEAWEVLYQHEGNAMVMERAWGEGSIVMLSGSYPFSNEAIREHRHPEFLAWIAGTHGNILFDETHLGVERQVGVMGLIKRFRLVPLLFTLLLLAGLHIWKSVATLTPRLETGADLETLRNEEGQSDAAGLTNLMRRGVPSKMLLLECYRAWKHDFGRDARYKGKVEQELSSLMDGRAGGTRWQEILLNNYAAACQALRGRNRKG